MTLKYDYEAFRAPYQPDSLSEVSLTPPPTPPPTLTSIPRPSNSISPYLTTYTLLLNIIIFLYAYITLALALDHTTSNPVNTAPTKITINVGLALITNLMFGFSHMVGASYCEDREVDAVARGFRVFFVVLQTAGVVGIWMWHVS